MYVVGILSFIKIVYVVSSDKENKLPLHVACENNAHFGVIKYLIQCDETKYSLKQEDFDGRVPLHLSCINDAPLEIVTYLANIGGRETIQSIPYSLRRSTHKGVLLSYKSYTSPSSSGREKKQLHDVG